MTNEKTSTVGNEKSKTVKELRATIKAMSMSDFDDFDLEMPALLKKAYKLVQTLAAS
jgi:hypothetical protein